MPFTCCTSLRAATDQPLNLDVPVVLHLVQHSYTRRAETRPKDQHLSMDKRAFLWAVQGVLERVYSFSPRSHAVWVRIKPGNSLV